jgi:hypothetical protein
MFSIQRDRRNREYHSSRAAFSVIMIALLLPLAYPMPAAANAPAEVQLSYDISKRALEVKITHPSKSPQRHYIEKVAVIKNGSQVSEAAYKNQPDQETYSYSYPLDAAPGDVLEAKASCSIVGSKTGKLTVR